MQRSVWSDTVDDTYERWEESVANTDVVENAAKSTNNARGTRASVESHMGLDLMNKSLTGRIETPVSS